MKKEDILKYIKTNNPLFYKNQRVFAVGFFEEFDLVEILNEEKSISILADISLLSAEDTEDNKEEYINIFRGGI